MGYFKDKTIESKEEGAMHPFQEDKYICAKHFDDQYLQEYIQKNGQKGKCSYCGDTASFVIRMEDFMEHVESKLRDRFSLVEEANLPLASTYYEDGEEEIPGLNRTGDYAVPASAERYENVNEMLYAYGLVTLNDELNDDISACFDEGIWIKKNISEEDLDVELSYAWESFCKVVKHKRRYTYYNDEDFVGQEKWKEDILTEVMNLCKEILVSSLPKGEIIYRGRINNTGKPFDKFEELTAPPVDFAKENRMSPEGISMFYGAFDKDTPIKEIRNYNLKSTINLGKFETKKELFVVNLCKIPDKISFWMPQHFSEYKFLKKFHSEITKPVDKNPGIEYVPTQVFTEYIRFMNHQHLDGIIYRSSQTNLRNIALFYDNKTSKNILQLIDVDR